MLICLLVNSVCYIGCLTAAHKKSGKDKMAVGWQTAAHKVENSYLHEQIGD
jgi:hypothetical protein